MINENQIDKALNDIGYEVIKHNKSMIVARKEIDKGCWSYITYYRGLQAFGISTQYGLVSKNIVKAINRIIEIEDYK